MANGLDVILNDPQVKSVFVNVFGGITSCDAVATGIVKALEILGDEVPDHLVAAGQLRVTHRQASLEELGRLADPPMTKDAVAGRIRRLLSMADRKAKQEGLPDTESAVTPDLLDDAGLVPSQAIRRKESLFGDTKAHGAEGVRFFTRQNAITTRWLDPSHGGINLGFPENK